MKTYESSHGGRSPWSLRQRLAMIFWEAAWFWLCQWTPKPFNPWRIIVLKLFGATIHGQPFVHQRARILIPWNIELRNKACIGDRANLYSLERIIIGERSIVAQEAYLCTGTHGSWKEGFVLKTEQVEIGRDVFVGARAFILPGCHVGDESVVGACAVVVRDVPTGARVVGSPARSTA
jgi:putative colanic acid biosynthesis acetyltransferase WcaF